MHYLVFIYLVLLSVEGALKIKPLMELSEDFELTYNFFILLLIGFFYFVSFLLKAVNGKLKLNLRNFFFGFHALVFISCIQVLIFNPGLFTGSFSLLIQFILQSIIFVVIQDFFGKRDVKLMMLLLTLFAFGHCLLTYITYFNVDFLADYTENLGLYKGGVQRSFGLIGDAGPWILSFFAILALQKNNFLLYLFYAGSSVLGASIGSSALLIFASFVCLMLRAKSRTIFYVITGLVGFIGIAEIASNPKIISEINIVNRLNDKSTFTESSGAQRLFSYGLAVDMIKSRPILGYGYGTFFYNLQAKYGNQFKRWKFKQGALSNANNQFLQTAYEIGFIGLFVFLFMLYEILKNINMEISYESKERSIYNFKRASFAWLLSYIIVNQTAVWLIPGIVWGVLIIILGINYKINLLYPLAVEE